MGKVIVEVIVKDKLPLGSKVSLEREYHGCIPALC
jgi:hypothetical protein